MIRPVEDAAMLARTRMTRERVTLTVLRSIPVAMAIELAFVGLALFALVVTATSH